MEIYEQQDVFLSENLREKVYNETRPLTSVFFRIHHLQ
jgi:hypothetical protein